MKRVLKWLATKFSPHSATVEADERHTPVGVSVRPTQNAQKEYDAGSGPIAGVPGQVESQEPGKDIPMPNIYACDDTITQAKLSVLDESSLDAGESAGFDPYNSGSFETPKSGSRK